MRYIRIIFYPVVSLLSWHLYAASPAGCTAKINEIENQITYAREYNNTYRIAGLQKALRETEEHCTGPQLLKQRQMKVEEKKRKVAECQAELEQARENGTPKKIAQKQKKLDHAREELQEALNRLNQ